MTYPANLFITFEGIEGCGKTTQAQLLADLLEKQGKKVLLTREPGGPRISEKIRSLLLDKELTEMHKITELFLYMASRSQHTKEWIIPALQNNTFVICDRYYDSTYAYQGNARDIDASEVACVNSIATGGLTPDLTFILDLPAEKGLLRVKKLTQNGKHMDRLEREALTFHEHVRQGFLDIAERNSERCVLVDADNSIEDIHAIILRALTQHLSI